MTMHIRNRRGLRLRERVARFILSVQRRWYDLSKWQRIGSATLAGVVLLAAIIPTAQYIIVSRRYELNAQIRQLIGEPNQNLARKITHNTETNSWQFNQSDIPIGSGNGTSGTQQAGMPSLNDLKAQVGGSGAKDKNLYAVDMPADGSKGVTYYDTNTDLSFSLVPQFEVGEGRQKDGHLVFPSEKGTKLIYTAKTNGMKEDIVLTKPIGDELEFAYDLKLPSTLEAKIQDDGSLGVFSPSPTLFGNISMGGDQDREKILSARKTAVKDHLLFVIPAPVIIEAGGTPANAYAKFTLSSGVLRVKALGLQDLKYPLSIDPSVAVTSASDFEAGNNEGMIEFGNGQINRANLTGGSIEAWTASSSNGMGQRYAGGSVIYNNYMYITGGATGSGIYSAPLTTSTGTIGNWSSASTDPVGSRMYPGMAAYNGYMYLFGGALDNTTALLNDVWYAPINSDGTIGTWSQSSNNMAFGACRAGATMYNGYLYAVGGATGTIADSCGNSSATNSGTVQYAPIKANGDVGTWSTSANTIPARKDAGVVAYNGYLYALGGTTDGVTNLTTVQYAPILSNGNTGAWVTSATTTQGDSHFRTATYNGYLYINGGTNTGTKTRYALIKANGDIGGFMDTSAMVDSKWGHAFHLYKGYAYYAGGSTGATVLSSSGSAKIRPAGTTANFATVTNNFSTPRALTCSVAYNGYLYAIGGSTSDSGSNNVTTVQYTTINSSTGDVGNWTSTTALPEARGSAGCTAYNGYLYVISGYTGNAAGSTDVRYAPLNASTGAVGTWATTAPSLPSYKLRAGVFTYTTSSGTYLYAIGGKSDTGTNSTKSYYALLGSNGSVGSWSTATALLGNGYIYQAYTQVGKYIYAIGGQHEPNSQMQSGVEYASIGSTGDIAAWSTTAALNTPTGFTNGATVNGCVYAVGGKDNSFASLANVQYACPATNGSISAWHNAPHLTVATTDMGVTSYNGYLYGVGGYTASVQGTTQFAAVNNGGGGGLSAWVQQASGLGSPLYSHGFTYSNGYFYLIGGDDSGDGTGATTKSWYAPLNSDGGIGTWTATSTLNTARNSHATYVSGGYMYVAGGLTAAGESLSSAEYAPINSNGTLGAWTTATATLSTATSQQAFTSHNGNLYALGGTTGSLATTVYYANVSNDGNFSSWSTTTALPYGVRAASAVVNNGYLYIIGGIDSSGSTGKVIYAPINGNGTLGSWMYTTEVPMAGVATAVIANGQLYASSIEGSSCTGNTYRATIHTDGSLAPFQQTVANNTCGHANGSGVYVKGRIYIETGGGTTRASNVNSIARLAHYTKRLNLGGAYTLSSITYGGSLPNGGIANIAYRTANSESTYGSPQKASSLPGTLTKCSEGVDTQYVQLQVTLDDTADAAFPDANSTTAHVTDMTVNFQSSPAETSKRLAHGKFFSGETLTLVDTCGS